MPPSESSAVDGAHPGTAADGTEVARDGTDETSAADAVTLAGSPDRARRHETDRPGRRRAGPRTSVLRGSALGLGGAVVSALGGFALVVTVTRQLGAAVSGEVFVAIALATVLANVCKLGIDTSLVRFVPRVMAQGAPHAARRLLRLGVVASLACSCAVAAVLLLLAHPVAGVVYGGDAHGDGAGVALVRMVALMLPLGTLSLVLVAFSRGFGSVAPFVTVEQVLKPVLRPLLVVLFSLVAVGARSAFAAWLVPIVPGVVVAAVTVRARLRTLARVETEAPAGRPPAVPDAASDAASAAVPVSAGPSPREFWGFAVPRAFAGALEILGPWVGVLLLSALTGSRDAGVFTAATRVVTLGAMVLVAMRLALGPHLSAAFAVGDAGTLDRLHRHSTVVAVLLSFPFFVVIAVLPGATLDVFGSSFSDGAAALLLLALANLVNVAVGNVQSVVLMAGRSRWNLGNAAAALGVQVAVGAALIPLLGLNGAALGLATGVVVNNVLSARQARRLGIVVWSREVVAAVALSVAVSLPVALAARVVLGPDIVALGAAFVVSVAAMAAILVTRPGVVDLRASLDTLTRNLGRAT